MLWLAGWLIGILLVGYLIFRIWLLTPWGQKCLVRAQHEINTIVADQRRDDMIIQRTIQDAKRRPRLSLDVRRYFALVNLRGTRLGTREKRRKGKRRTVRTRTKR